MAPNSSAVGGPTATRLCAAGDRRSGSTNAIDDGCDQRWRSLLCYTEACLIQLNAKGLQAGGTWGNHDYMGPHPVHVSAAEKSLDVGLAAHSQCPLDQVPTPHNTCNLDPEPLGRHARNLLGPRREDAHVNTGDSEGGVGKLFPEAPVLLLQDGAGPGILR
jgi:hypothetical protein